MLGYRPLRGLNGQMHMPSKIEKKQAAAKLRKPPRDFSYTQNRELSWLRFDNRVLDEAFDESVPLFERLKFVSIFESNLDEFLMVRVGGLSDLAELKKQPVDNKSNMTAGSPSLRASRASSTPWAFTAPASIRLRPRSAPL